ncbi:hypothetical protein EJ08DRAFT_737850 [Tothia fuscella]|uniref:Uncharacterized protein n=1 Tax=Tothia fuscella TaxID=1048955 RepID=A0A9P4TUM7_9PEZI|nr:hypothetical protein EJ08DRAFT_737850 [Tothia fuscella]
MSISSQMPDTTGKTGLTHPMEKAVQASSKLFNLIFCVVMALIIYTYGRYEQWDPYWGEAWYQRETIAGVEIQVFYEPLSPQHIGVDRVLSRADGVLLLYGVNSKQSLENVPKYHARMLRVLEGKKSPQMVVVATSIELPQAEWEITTEDGHEMAKMLNAGFAECSAKTGSGLREAVHQAMKPAFEERMRSLEEKSRRALEEEQEQKRLED